MSTTLCNTQETTTPGNASELLLRAPSDVKRMSLADAEDKIAADLEKLSFKSFADAETQGVRNGCFSAEHPLFSLICHCCIGVYL